MGGLRLDDTSVLVTGGAGFIGSNLVAYLLENSNVHEVRVLDNLVNGRLENLADYVDDGRLTFIRGDILDRGTLDDACHGAQVVFHLACLGVRHSLHSPMDAHRVNAEGTLLCLLAAEAAGVPRFLYTSSSEVFGTAQFVPMTESHPTWPETVYGASKLAGEAYARAFFRTNRYPTVVVRPFNTYGPRSHFEADCGEFLPRSIVRVLGGLAPVVFGDGAQTRDFLHVSDTVRAIVELAMCDSALGRSVNVGSGREVSLNALCRLIADLSGRPGLEPDYLEDRPGDVRRLWSDNALVHQLIGFTPQVQFSDGLSALIDWFRARLVQDPDMLAMIPARNW